MVKLVMHTRLEPEIMQQIVSRGHVNETCARLRTTRSVELQTLSYFHISVRCIMETPQRFSVNTQLCIAI